MAQHKNLFALLEDVEGDTVSKPRHAKLKPLSVVAEKKKQQQPEVVVKKDQSASRFHAANMLRAKPLELPDYVVRSHILLRRTKPKEQGQASGNQHGVGLGKHEAAKGDQLNNGGDLVENKYGNGLEKVYKKIDNNMTLKEYEKVSLEKRNTLKALKKTEERKVTLDKDFESMKLGGKKKEDGLSTKLKAHDQKDKYFKGKNTRKSMSIDEFLKAVKSTEMPMVGHGRGEHGGFLSWAKVEADHAAVLSFEDSDDQFPGLLAAAKQ